MNATPASGKNWQQMREEVSRMVNSLEMCWSCERICRCDAWLANEAVPVWLCGDCAPEAAYRLEKQSGVPISLVPVESRP